MTNQYSVIDRPRCLAVLLAGAAIAGSLTFIVTQTSEVPLFICSFTRGFGAGIAADKGNSAERLVPADYATTPIQLLSILHYATSKITPQQSFDEVKLSFDVLQSLAPCNFLVYGLGFDSLMWDSLNPRGATLFLEEDPHWIRDVLKKSPVLRASTVNYHTHLSEADELLHHYRTERACWPANMRRLVKGKQRCRLGLGQLPDVVYEKEWDVIMIDAPRGYFPAAPGRMAAIYSAAVMARSRRNPGVTHVYLHDVDRKVEKEYAEEFLCMKYKVNGVGRIWHFAIPSAINVTVDANDYRFC